MSLNKSIIIGSAIFTILTLPVLASAASGVQTNSTINEATSFSYVNSHQGYCPSTQVTSAHGKLFIPIEDIRMRCGLKKSGTCEIDLFASNNCTGAKIGNVSVDLATANVTVNYTVGPYKPYASGSNLYIDSWS